MLRPGFSVAALLLAAFAVLPSELWLGLMLGALLAALLLRSRYQESFLLFVGIPGLYRFTPLLSLGAIDGESLLVMFTEWAILSAALLCLGVVLSGMDSDKRFAPLRAVPMLLLNPSGLALAGLIGAQLLWTWERQRPHLDLGAEHKRLILAALLIGAPLIVGVAGLPRLALPSVTDMTRDLAEDPSIVDDDWPYPDAPEGTPQPETHFAPAEATPWSRAADSITQGALNVALLIGSLILFGFTILLLRHHPWRWRKPKDLLPALSLFLSLAMLITWLALNRPGEGGEEMAQPGEPPLAPLGDVALPEAVEQTLPSWARNLASTVSLVTALIILVASVLVAFLLWRAWRWSKEAEARSDTRTTLGVKAESKPPEDRIRRAYQSFLHDMYARGFGRSFWESPRRYAERLGDARAELQDDLLTLTLLYESVRYGERSRDEDADTAERLAMTLPQHFIQATDPVEANT